jgi:diacylglycerol kinase family enzyme
VPEVGTAELVTLVVALVSVALVGGGLLWRGGRPGRAAGRSGAVAAQEHTGVDAVGAPDGPRRLPAVVINPSKFDDVAPLREAIERAVEAAGWAPPLWLETTVDDPGTGQTHQALEAGAEIVLACGGDGTVRCVGQALAGTGVPLGLVPAGTGNLLARNLDVVTPRSAQLSPDDAEAATRAALAGEDRAVDVGWVTVIGAAGEERGRPEERAFLVMAGMGFDAAIMEHAPEALKARVGPAAYVVSGLQHFNGDRAKVRLTLDGATHTRRVRTVVIGNVGRLQGGLALMPDAEVDDGWLDVVAIGPRNVAQWLGVVARVLTRRRRNDAALESWRARTVTLRTSPAQPAQLDGDPIGSVTEMRMRVDERVLLVRVAPGSGAKEVTTGERAEADAGTARARAARADAVRAGARA